MIRKFSYPVLLGVILFILSFTLTTQPGVKAATPSPATYASGVEVAQLAQTVESLQAEIVLLRKNIQVLADLLDDMVTAISKTNATHAPAAKVKPVLAKLRSPRQLDRPAIGAEKIPLYEAKIKVEFDEPEAQKVFIALVTTKKNSSFVKSLKAQLTTWLDTTAAERIYDSPMSPKQFAWARFLMFPTEFGNPKLDKNLYPQG